MVGGYAIAPSWADGHHTGYYTFTMLRDRCPCDTCAARRQTGAPAVGSTTVADRHEEHA
jgi:Gamma-butyrobetaine hydroxylase-like, N-terminal